DEHGAQPDRHARVEPVLEEIEGKRPRRDEEHEDPDRPVVEAVIELVAFADLALGRVLDRNVHVWGFGLLNGARPTAEYTPTPGRAARRPTSRGAATAPRARPV